MKEDKKPRNTKGQRHGYWESYYYNGQIMHKCIFINGKINGFEEWYYFYGKITGKRYHL